MELNPYLTFDGNCAEAFAFYRHIFGGRLEELLTHGESPMCDQIPGAWHDKIMHARLVIGDRALMGSDAPPDHREAKQGFSVAVNVDDSLEAERLFSALAEGGTVRMPLQETFWAVRFGTLVDRYGVPWMINCAAPKERPAPRYTDRGSLVRETG